MLKTNLRKALIAAACAIALLFVSTPVLSNELHENPEAAEQLFSGVSLLRYNSDALDFLLQKNPVEVEARLEKMTYANIPQDIEQSESNFATSSISLSPLVITIDQDLAKLRELKEQSRLDEATALASQISDNLTQANSAQDILKETIETIGSALKVSSSPQQSELRLAFDGVMERINRIRQMLGLFRSVLSELSRTPEVLRATELTLTTDPKAAFVGDIINFAGTLLSDGKPLAGREVDVMLNGSENATANTDENGQFQGVFHIPYWYAPDLEVKGLYYPRGTDTGVFQASLSLGAKIRVLFYQAKVNIGVKDKAYLGREADITGQFDYGQSPVLSDRKVEVYLDDFLTTEFTAGDTFEQSVELPPGVEVGRHVITLSATPSGKYSPATASAALNVVKATPTLELDLPRLVIIPGNLTLAGRLYSEIGPLSKASVKIKLGRSEVDLTSSEAGNFETAIKTGMDLTLLGSQDITIQVLSGEPWHSSLIVTENLMTANVVNLSALAAALVFLGFYLPRRLGKKFGIYPRKKVEPALTHMVPDPVLKDQATPAVSPIKESAQSEPRDRVLDCYRLIVRFIQQITKHLFSQQKTLREFAEESSQALGLAGKYFTELTKTVERMLYSHYVPTEADVEHSRQLSGQIEEMVALTITVLPKVSRRVSGENKGASVAAERPPIFDGSSNLDRDSRIEGSKPVKVLPVLLWIVLVMAVAYYACILFWMLPVLLRLIG